MIHVCMHTASLSPLLAPCRPIVPSAADYYRLGIGYYRFLFNSSESCWSVVFIDK